MEIICLVSFSGFALFEILLLLQAHLIWRERSTWWLDNDGFVFENLGHLAREFSSDVVFLLNVLWHSWEVRKATDLHAGWIL